MRITAHSKNKGEEETRANDLGLILYTALYLILRSTVRLFICFLHLLYVSVFTGEMKYWL